jgi:uncharacterized protein
LLVGILSDTHNEVPRTKEAVKTLCSSGAEMLIHCGDLSLPEIVEACSVLPFYFVFGNHDSDMVPDLRSAAQKFQATCLDWGGTINIEHKTIAVAHGHLTMDLAPLIEMQPDYLCTGHSHIANDWDQNGIHRINPGALFRADRFTVALLDTTSDNVSFLTIPE